jgi:heme exporter protein D|tara:strand:- start:485 stop:706 length:222 start_codon:yes stop_codon:yes gene_type:complete
MINELILMNGYGPFVWSAFIFTGISFVSLYLIIKLQLEKETNKFTKKFNKLSPEKIKEAKKQTSFKELLQSSV